MPTDYIVLALGLLLIVIAVSVLRCRSLLSAVMLMSAFSVTMAVCFVLIASVDVAITEAVVGGGFVTALYLVALGKTQGVEE